MEKCLREFKIASLRPQGERAKLSTLLSSQRGRYLRLFGKIMVKSIKTKNGKTNEEKRLKSGR